FYSPLEEVGGDWYNFRFEESGSISAQVADVSGHGLAAAFLGSMAKLGFSAVTEERPHELFERINKLLTPQMPAGRFVTMCGFLYNPENGHIDFARAGHQPALILRNETREIEELKGEGFAMGFFDTANYTHEESELGHGDSIAIFSDGLVEAQNRASETFDLKGVSASLASASKDATAEELTKKIIRDFENFLDGRVLKDDVTLMLLKRK
ncbi:MAG: serine/threonine-protein phosphatase, partial [SAR324 cluster bacterium]|nr:serine/threonine-protein phosphatase [SAR324 cluster bacterium]